MPRDAYNLVVKLLFYSHAFAPQIGGIETYSSRLVEGLASYSINGPGFEITVATQTPGDGVWQSPHPGVQIVRQPSLKQLWKLVGDADCVMLAGAALGPLLIGLLRRKTVLVTHHGYQTVCPNGLLFNLRTQKDCPDYFSRAHYLQCVRCGVKEMSLFRSVLRILFTFPRRGLSQLATQNILVSEHLGRRVRLRNSVLIRNGVPVTSCCQDGVTRAESSIPQLFVYVGRLVVEKGVNVLVQASAILNKRGYDHRISLIGDGPERTKLEALARQLNVSHIVQFRGFLKGPELEAGLNSACALVMPSVCQDVAPFAPLEQMMRGRAIIASDIGGLSEEVGDAGLKFTPGNPIKLADRMQELILSPDLAGALAQRGRERSLKLYTSDAMVIQYAELLKFLTLK